MVRTAFERTPGPRPRGAVRTVYVRRSNGPARPYPEARFEHRTYGVRTTQCAPTRGAVRTVYVRRSNEPAGPAPEARFEPCTYGEPPRVARFRAHGERPGGRPGPAGITGRQPRVLQEG